MITRLDPDEKGELERERDFLLKSLDDLETERAAGNIDDASYTELHDDYTARAAATIRALRDGVDARPGPPPVPLRRRGLVVGGIVAFAVVAAVALAAALGARLPGQTSSGNQPTAAPSSGERKARLQEAADKNPNDPQAGLAFARFLEESGDTVESLKQYDKVVAVAPDNADALANAGRLRFIVAGQVPSPDAQRQLVGDARTLLDRAVQADPNNADARYYRGVLLLDGFGQVDAAIGEFQRYLVLAPDGRFSTQARSALAKAVEQPPTSGSVPP
ncbi:MAG TPA: tetratricopeptide repeat protein [Acidimicrobiia bacterium]|nr:tetratricopeptide repeat protein [Acidimicrobiia bacterium]